MAFWEFSEQFIFFVHSGERFLKDFPLFYVLVNKFLIKRKPHMHRDNGSPTATGIWGFTPTVTLCSKKIKCKFF